MDSFAVQMAQPFAVSQLNDPYMSFDMNFQQPGCAAPLASTFICPQDVSRSEELDNMSACMSTVDDGFQRSNSSAPPNKKKRKSWGQVLPKPTTNLPPRKRAKTEEEKAQRKYERVQRNRHAAHMSRMRKQDEMEQLKHQNDVLKQDNQSLSMEISRLQEELRRTSGSNRQSSSPANVLESLEAPSLTSSLSPSSPSLESDAITTPPPLDQSTYQIQTSKQPGASHSAVMCSQQWTPGSLSFPMGIKQENFMPM